MTKISGRALWSVLAGILIAAAVLVLLRPVPKPRPVTFDPGSVADLLTTPAVTQSKQDRLPAAIAELPADQAAAKVAADPDLAVALTLSEPRSRAADPVEAGLATLVSTIDDPDGWRLVAEVFALIDPDAADWLAVAFPSAIGNLAGAPYPDRIDANRIRLAAAISQSRLWPSPPRPWTQVDRQPRADLEAVYEANLQLIYFDPLANSGQGSWVELVGDLDSASRVGVLVPGGSAFIVSDNFFRYSGRAKSFVDAADGELAMIVWAGAPFPSGWIEEAGPDWAREAAPLLTGFMADLDNRLDTDIAVTLAGHSYGGAIVGLAETLDLVADQVMQVASAGAGYGVTTPLDYTQPCRRRYDMMAPKDPISYVQNIPGFTGLGHGVSPADLAGTLRLATGTIPDDPDALDDAGRRLGSQGLQGKEIAGLHAHSEVFIPNSTAWRNMLAVFTLDDPSLLRDQPPPLAGCR